MEDLKVCWTCSKKQNLLKIEEHNGLQDLISTVLEIQPHPLFELICQECKVYLEKFRDFKQTAQASAQALRESLLKPASCSNSKSSEEHLAIGTNTDDYQNSNEPHSLKKDLQGNNEKSGEQYEVIKSNDPKEPEGIRCLICFRTFTLISAWRRHNNRIHQTTPQLFECHFCQMKFAAKVPLKRHVLRHVEDPFICFKCGVQFYSKYNLEAHIKRQ